MTEHGEFHDDRSGGPHRPPDDFDDIVAQPALAGLVGRGARLDRLPLGRAAAAFLAGMFVSHLVFGPAGAVLVVVVASVPLMLAAVLVRDGEVDAGRLMLRTVIGVLMGWTVLVVLLVSPPSLETPSRPVPQRSPAHTARGVSAPGSSWGAETSPQFLSGP